MVSFFSPNGNVCSDFSVPGTKARLLLLLSVDHWTRYELKGCTIPNMSNTHLFSVPLFGADSLGHPKRRKSNELSQPLCNLGKK